MAVTLEPLGLNGTPSWNFVTLWWTNQEVYDEIWVYRGVNGGTRTLQYKLYANETSCNDVGLVDGYTYSYFFKAIAAGKTLSFASNNKTVTTIIIDPNGLTATPGETTVDLAWNDNSAGESQYRVYRNGSLIETLAAGSTSYQAIGLSKNTDYTFEVSCWNAWYGESGKASVATHTLSLPAIPTSVVPTVLGTTSIQLDWIDGAGTTRIYIERKVSGGAWAVIGTYVASGVQTYTDTGLIYGTLYYYRARGWNSDGYGAYSAEATETTTEHIAWVKLALADARPIDHIDIKTPADNFKGFTVHGSLDDSAWTLLYTGEMDGTAALNHFTFVNAVAYSYLKITSTSNYAKQAMKIFTLNGYETVPANEWVKIDAGANKVVRRIIITPYASGVQNWELYGATAAAPTVFVLITYGVCDPGSSENEFLFDNAVIYDNYKLVVLDSYSAASIGVCSWSLYEETPSGVDTNYYLFTQAENDIVRKVIFADYDSMIDFITEWKAANVGWATTYFCTALTIPDIDSAASIATAIHDKSEIDMTLVLLESKINETLSVISLLAFYAAGTLFGTPAAYAISLSAAGPTSLHELKRRNLKQELVGGVWTDVSPEEYIQNKFVFATAESNLLLCSIDEVTGKITGYTIIGSSLSTDGEPCWANFQNRAFMVNGAESDRNAIWTDGEAMYLNGIVAPVMITDVTAHTIATTAVNTTDNEITIAAHGYKTNQRVTYANGGGASITGLTTATIYYVIYHDANTIKLATAADGAAIDLTGTGNNAQTITGTPITQVATGGYMSDGAYSLKVRYHRSTYGTNDSNPSAEASITLNGTGAVQRIIIDLLISSDPQVDKIYVYRTKLLDAIFYKAAEVANTYDPTDPKVVQLSITANDNSLGTAALETDNDPAPKSKFIVTLGAINRVGYITDEGVYFSKAGFPEQVPLENFIPIGKDDGEMITGSIVVNGWWLIGKETQIFAIDLNNITTLKALCISGSVGVLDWKTMALIEDGQAAMWLSQLGWAISDGVNVTNVSRGKTAQDEDGNVILNSRNMDDFINNFDFDNKSKASAVFYPKRQQYICYVPYKGVDSLGRANYRIWIYDIVKGSFYKSKPLVQPLRLFTLTDKNDIKQLVFSFTQSYLDELYGYFMHLDDETDRLDTASITFAGIETRLPLTVDFITSWFDLGLPERNKSFRMLYAEFYSSAAVDITVSVGINHRKKYVSALVGGIDIGTMQHLGQTGAAPTEGRDEIEGFDYGRSQTIPIPVDAVGENFSIRFQWSADAKVRLNSLTPMFRVRGPRPLP